MNPSPHSFPNQGKTTEKSMGVPELLVTSVWKYCNSYYDISGHDTSLNKLINNILNPEIIRKLKDISINDVFSFERSSLANILYNPNTYKKDIIQILKHDNAYLSFFNTHGIIQTKQKLFENGYGGTHQPDSLVAMALLCLSDLSVVKRSIREKFVSNINPTESDTSLKIKHSLLKLYSQEPTNNGEVNTTLHPTNSLYNKVDISFNTKTLEVLCFKLRKNLTYNTPNFNNNNEITICCGFYQAGILAIKYAIDYIDHYQIQNNSQLNPKQIFVCVDRVSDQIEDKYLQQLIKYINTGNIIISFIEQPSNESKILPILSCVKFIEFDEKHVYNIRPDLSFNELNISLKNNLKLTDEYKKLLFIGGIDMTLPLYIWSHDKEEDDDKGNELFEKALNNIYLGDGDGDNVEIISISNRVNQALTNFL